MSDIDPELYALVHDGVPGDLELYARVTTGAGDVLELGAGWGRVSLALAELGHNVVGVERDAGMRAMAERRRRLAPAAVRERVSLVDADMTSVSLGRTFDRVIIPFTGLYCLLSEESVLQCFRCVAAHLGRDGAFVFDAYAADGFHAHSLPEDYPDDELEEVARIEHDGVPLTVFERSTWDRDAQRMDATYLHLDEEGRLVHEYSIGHRYLLTPQIEPLLQAAGLRLRSLHGSFEGATFDPERSGSVVVVATLA